MLPLHKALEVFLWISHCWGLPFIFKEDLYVQVQKNQGITGSKTNGSFPSNMAVKILSEKCDVVLQEQAQALMSVDKLMTAAYQLIS